MRIAFYVTLVFMTLMVAACASGDDELQEGAQSPPTEAGVTEPAAPGMGKEAVDPVPGVVYVDVDNTAGPWTGTSWATAFQSVQAGLDAAAAAGGGEVWVAEGTYSTTGDGDREVSFGLRGGVALFGGFQGSEAARNQRDWEIFPTVLSGDIGMPEDASDNARHVVVGADDAIIDGFTITGGNAIPAGPDGPVGPGVPGGPPGEGERQTHTTPEEIVASSAGASGGGLLNFDAAPVVRNCVIRDNQAGKGGGVYNMVRGGGTPVFVNVIVRDNYAPRRGGGMANDLRTNPLLVNVQFINNRTDEKGGGLYNDFDCSPMIVNGLFVGNEADTAAAMGNDGSSSPLIVNCTFADNVAADMGAGLYQGTYNPSGTSSNDPTVRNSIVWGNVVSNFGPVSVYNWADSAPDIRRSIVEGGYPGEGNLDADPLFKDSGNGDYALVEGSPAIDAGADGYLALSVDILGRARNGAADLGAYEWDADTGVATGAEEIQELVATLLEAASSRTQEEAGPPPGGGRGWSAPQVEAEEFEIPDHVVFVNGANKSGPGDGTSWETALQTVQAGIDAAEAAGGGEVWVSAGTYTPADGDNRAASIALRPYVAVYGGFNGDESSREQRDWEANETILSGDIGVAGEATDNSFHVVTGAQYAILDGVTVASGYADGEREHRHGGGMLNYFPESSVTVRNVTFRDNYAVNGGAMYNFNYAYVMISDSIFVGNRAEFGGALHYNVGANGEVRDSIFEDNHALYRGGAVAIDYGSSPVFTGVAFSGNSTDGHGGAAWVNTRAAQVGASQPVFEDCRFSGNLASLRGGAVQNNDLSGTIILDSAFTHNRAGAGGGAVANDNSVVVIMAGNVFVGNEGGSGQADVDTDDSSNVLTEYNPGARQGAPPPGGPPPGGLPTPPQEAIDACSELVAGDACDIDTQEGTISGTCAVIGEVLACVP
jgi:hypothetical protein